MEYVKKTVLEIVEHIEDVVESISEREIEELVSLLIHCKRVFVYGVGRSGFVAKAFASRLSHLKFEVFVVGESITPAVREGDIFFTISGSGETSSVVLSAEAAKRENAKVIAVTSNRKSKLAGMADSVLLVKGRTKEDIKKKDYLPAQIMGKHAPLSPLGTLFEDTCQVILDGIIVSLMYKLRKTEEDLARRHCNVE